MTRQLWLNLPVSDVSKARDFYLAIGFRLNERYPNGPETACMLIGERSLVMMLCSEKTFNTYTQFKVADTSKGSEVLFSIDAESPEEVDLLTKAAQEAGGSVFAPPSEQQGWMYGSGFCDPDGHRWNVLYMDMSKMPK